MRKKERIEGVLNSLDLMYGPVKCFLVHENAWQLLIATILSAQCTDDRVNIVTSELFKKYKSLEEFANADLIELEGDIRSTGFFRNKAKNIIACSKSLVVEHAGIVPEDIDMLTKLAGVGRKTANVIRGNIYDIPSIVVDTHVKRVSNLLGFVKSEDPVKIEFALMKIIPKEHWIRYNTQIIAHGRKVCVARRPDCQACMLNTYCDYFNKKP